MALLISNHHVLVQALVLLTLSALEPAAWGQVDRVQRRNGTDLGTITETSPLAVTISKGGVTSKIPVEEIRSITFDEEPAELASARRAISRGHVDSALDTLERIDPRELSRTEIQQELSYLTVACEGQLALAGQGEPLEIAEKVDEFIAQNRTSYHIPDALELQGDLLLAGGNATDARRKYETLAKSPATFYKIRSADLVGRCLLQDKKCDEALASFESGLKLADGSAVIESQLLEAKLGKAVSLAALGKLDEGREIIRRIVVQAAEDDTSTLAKAYNALGDCYRFSGNPRAARDAYLHVDLLFDSESTEHAEALARLATLWTELSQPTRAKATEERLVREYPWSRWRSR